MGGQRERERERKMPILFEKINKTSITNIPDMNNKKSPIFMILEMKNGTSLQILQTLERY
jgi:hypothetical protein